MALITLTCPNCSGKAEVDDSRESAICPYCNTKFLLDHPPTRSADRPQLNPVPQMPPNVAAAAQGVKKAATGCFAAIFGFFALCIILIIVAAIFSKKTDSRETAGRETAAETVITGDPVINADDFIRAAKKAGYTMVIEDDYDGFGTYWAGAHKFAEGAVQKEGNEIYVIDYTRDASVYNSKVEYNLYVAKVNEIGGDSFSDSGSGYQLQVGSSDTKFGIAYRIGDVNLFVVADAKYKQEITAFFDAIGFSVEGKK